MKNNIIALCFLPLALFSCKNNDIVAGAKSENQKCNATAGYQWSQIKNDCIRVFEQKTQLRSIQKEPMEKICALIFSNDNNQVEVFLDNTIILTKNSSAEYTDSNNTNSYLLKKVDGKWQLLNNNKLMFTE